MELNVTFALYIIKRLVFTTEVESVYYAVGTESYTPDTFPPYRVKFYILLTVHHVMILGK
jgi:hypothetical protein